MATARALIVEDDTDINGIVAAHLEKHGLACTQAFSGSEAKLVLASDKRGFDVIICDLMLPGMSGEKLVEHIRERDPQVPVIVISARTSASDKVDLLRIGADDYLAKPFDLDELLARVDVQLRHRASPGVTALTGPTLRLHTWELDPDTRTFSVDGSTVELTRIEFNVIETLMRQPKRVFSKRELFERAWGEPYGADDNTVNVHVSNIRSKLRPTGTDSYIKTVWGMGFKLADD